MVSRDERNDLTGRRTTRGSSVHVAVDVSHWRDKATTRTRQGDRGTVGLEAPPLRVINVAEKHDGEHHNFVTVVARRSLASVFLFPLPYLTLSLSFLFPVSLLCQMISLSLSLSCSRSLSLSLSTSTDRTRGVRLAHTRCIRSHLKISLGQAQHSFTVMVMVIARTLRRCMHRICPFLVLHTLPHLHLALVSRDATWVCIVCNDIHISGANHLGTDIWHQFV